MAKVLFIVKKLPPNPDIAGQLAAKLIQSLAESQHQIRILTSYEPDVDITPIHKNVEILRPFRTWSLLELPHLATVTFPFQPDIVHYIPQSEKKRSRLPLLFAAPSLLKAMHQPSLVTHFFHFDSTQLNRSVKQWLALSDLVLVGNDYQRYSLSALPESPRHQIIDVLEFPHVDALLEPVESSWVFDAFSRYIYVPGFPYEHEQFSQVFDFIQPTLREQKDLGVIIGAPLSASSLIDQRYFQNRLESLGIRRQVVFVPKLTESTHQKLLKNAELIALSTLKLGSFSLTRGLHQAFHFKKVVLMSDLQRDFEKTSLATKKNAVFTGRDIKSAAESLRQIFADRKILAQKKANLESIVSNYLIEDPGNRVNRFYREILAIR